MKKYSTICLLFLGLSLSGCATKVTPTKETLTHSEACYDLAKYAKAVSFLLDAGIPLDELDEYTKVPVAVVIPVYALQAQVALSRFSNPGEAYSAVLSQCSALGWRNMLSFLTQKFPRAQLKLTRELVYKPKRQ